jgi:hypothetical protein
MLRRGALVRTAALDELSASFIRVTRIDGLGTTLAVTSNRRTLRRRYSSSETSIHHLGPEKERWIQENDGCGRLYKIGVFQGPQILNDVSGKTIHQGRIEYTKTEYRRRCDKNIRRHKGSRDSSVNLVIIYELEQGRARTSSPGKGTVFTTHFLQGRNPSLQLSIQCAPQCTPKQPSNELHGATRQQAIAKTPAKQSAFQIHIENVLFVV